MFLSPLSQCTSEDAVEYPNTLNNNAIYNATEKSPETRGFPARNIRALASYLEDSRDPCLDAASLMSPLPPPGEKQSSSSKPLTQIHHFQRQKGGHLKFVSFLKIEENCPLASYFAEFSLA